MITPAIRFPDKINAIFQKNDIVFAGIFGSRAKNRAQKNSDYDFLVKFDPKKKYTLLNIVTLKEDLEQALKHSVDVVTPNGLDRYIKQEVLDSVIPIYEQ